jgi:hypothetical protein
MVVRSVLSSVDIFAGGARQRASIYTDEHEQPGVSAKGSGQVRAGGRDASTSTWAKGDGAGQRASIYTDEHEQPGVCAEGSGQVRAGGRDASTNTRAKRDPRYGATPVAGPHEETRQHANSTSLLAKKRLSSNMCCVWTNVDTLYLSTSLVLLHM